MTKPNPFSGAYDGPRYEVIEITPEMAREMLTYNTHNRSLRDRQVKSLAADMADNAWVEDGQSIKFGTDGALLDGQHRLAAIIEADVKIRMLVVHNVPNAAQENMDTQAKRTFADVLKLRGEARSVALAAAARRVYMFEHGAPSGHANFNPTYRQLLQTLDTYPWLRDVTETTTRVSAQVPIPAGTLSLCYWMFVRIDPDDCVFFFARLSDGTGLLDGDAIHVLRRTVFAEQRGSARIHDTVMTAYVIKAWNAYRHGRKIGLLRYRPGGAKPEAFPTPE